MPFNAAEAKSIFTSKTFWGAIIGLISVIFPHFYEHVITMVGVSDPGTIVNTILGAVGGLLSIYGRWTATVPVTLTGK